MRNDVKLGFAIGGVLLAVLVVYVLVVPGSGSKNKVALNAGGKDGKVTLEPVAPAKPLTQAEPVSAPPQTFSPGASPSRDVIGGKPASGKAEPAKTPTDPFASNTASQGARTSAQSGEEHHAGGKTIEAAKANPNAPDWNRILNDQPTLIAQTPVAVAPQSDANSASTNAGPQDNPPQSKAGIEDSLPPTDAGIAPPEPAAPQPTRPSAKPADAPAGGGGTIHTVASGETFSSISASAYGSPNFYPAIMRANPSIDPQHLKPGMKITLPDVSQVKPSSAAGTSAGAGTVQLVSAKTAQTIDPKKQYRVQPGDSLYRIAVRLYGKGTYSDKLFELNQQAMGGDETRLRPGQVLQLPEPPTQGQ